MRERVRELGSVAEARDRIVRQALDCIDGESRRTKEEEAAVRREAGRVKSEIGRLLEVLKTLGARGLGSIEGELARLEGLEADFQTRLAELAARQVPMTRVAEDARRFVATWKDVGELLAQATPDEQHLILQHYIEVIELRATDLNGKAGTYAMRLFPEVRPHPKPDDEEGEAGARVPRQPTPPETPSGAVAPGGNDPALLTEDGVVRTAVQKAPRGDHSANQPLVEVGAYRIRKLRRGKQIIDFYPWTAGEAIPTSSPARPKTNRDPLALARHYQSLLDNGTASSKADLARHLGVSRARVTHVLHRLKTQDSPNTSGDQ